MGRALDVPVGLCVGYLLDRAVGDPRRWHPVAGLGRAIGRLERAVYADSRAVGVGFAATSVCASIALGVGVDRAARRADSSPVRIAAVAVATWAVLGGTTLNRVGREVADDLSVDDIDAARALVPSLCGRDPESLDAAGIVRAAVESIAENTSDAAVAPLFWGGVAGVPGLVAYRTVNTLDSMVGYRNDRYGRFGWASARLDDLANLVPARLAGVLVVVLGEDRAGALRAWRRDAAAHPSPNAGVVESSFAGALGLRLGGRTVYPHGVEERPALGDGRLPEVADLYSTTRLSRRVQIGALASSALIAYAIGALRRRR
ncbi:cobalamin biosynthesis protein CobD [Gordonia sputi NBRC 100414]|uniref:Cobalamin biosynthesis protein CobD n=1 Tax=Gordonia sputi NBRC 100414 TaxID=1089453 RepID=H5U1G2_9ACTN|nr:MULTISPECIES: cobalamin biosynthesis protein [Gordonia]NKY94420.1 cobalamin biosynthesis protein [Gordonia sputi]GAB39570.1 cobalamin biosynthesis protein CobD [Gordonia sputi NBRC 100414]